MQEITDKKEPEIIMIGSNELTQADLFRLNHVFHTDRGEFSILPRKYDIILLNRDMENIDEIKKTVESSMKMDIHNRTRDSLFHRMEKLAGEKSCRILMLSWLNWRDARRAADLKEEAEQIIRLCGKKRILRKAKKEKELLEMIHSIGFSMYDKGPAIDFSKGNEYCFAYGYLKALQSMG